MQGSSWKLLPALFIFCNVANAAFISPTPTIKSIHGGKQIEWNGFIFTVSLGKFASGNMADKGFIIKLGYQNGPKAMAVLDAGINKNNNMFGHLFAGTELSADLGAAAGIGGEMGLLVKGGYFALSANGDPNAKPAFVHKGPYTPVLLTLSDGYLSIMDKFAKV